VGLGHGNKGHGVAIGLTTGRMAVTAGSGRAPARAHGGGWRRRSRRLGELRRGGKMLANKRTHELPWELRKLAGRLDGGERGRRAPAACGGVNGAGLTFP
jgi:hypothetical protein